MGLDISAYSKLKKLDVVDDSDGKPIDPQTGEPLPWDSYVKVYVHPDYPTRAEPLEDGGVYEYDDRTGFRAGSYSWYNGWRNRLAKLAGYPLGKYPSIGTIECEDHAGGAWLATEGPFWELINFSDCEGTIGPVVAKKVLADFDAFDERASQAFDDGDYERYQCWHEAFRLASDHGCIVFH